MRNDAYVLILCPTDKIMRMLFGRPWPVRNVCKERNVVSFVYVYKAETSRSILYVPVFNNARTVAYKWESGYKWHYRRYEQIIKCCYKTYYRTPNFCPCLLSRNCFEPVQATFYVASSILAISK
jgi:hypothetical protein